MQFKLFDLGILDFQSAWDIQRELFTKVKQGELSSALLLCRHNPVITLGRTARPENILTSSEQLEQLKISTLKIERGGDVTYHGPGQLCVYPVINLNYLKKDINWYLRSLESLLLGVLAEFGIEAETRNGLTGIWAGTNKIASIGIAIKNWITFHGVSLNVKKNDLTNFSLIRPCGLDIIMTSMETLLREEVMFERVKEILIRRWYETSNFAGIGRGN